MRGAKIKDIVSWGIANIIPLRKQENKRQIQRLYWKEGESWELHKP